MRRAKNLRKVITCVLCLILPSTPLSLCLRLLGHKVAAGARIGFSFVYVDQLCLDRGARVGHFSLVCVKRVVLRRGAYFGHMNFLKGPFGVILGERAGIGNRNVVTRARLGVSYGPAYLKLGELTKITAGHKIDCMNSVHFGAYCTLAGAGTQIWTHGYVHSNCGPERYRIDGGVRFGNNVNVGSRSIITGGVTIADGIMVGVGTTISKNLYEQGHYVSGPLRRVELPAEPATRKDMKRVVAQNLVETVYRKHDSIA
ncbi:acyltransferase [Qipengyuania gaetbuli]|uniref:acyltransferase n=1 Tax=Qipengyuania gaetbuli TaxID=266952 RepID=UPI001CFCCE72|nr:hypothetical protein [Qipengyuania gaetbuli]